MSCTWNEFWSERAKTVLDLEPCRRPYSRAFFLFLYGQDCDLRVFPSVPCGLEAMRQNSWKAFAESHSSLPACKSGHDEGAVWDKITSTMETSQFTRCICESVDDWGNFEAVVRALALVWANRAVCTGKIAAAYARCATSIVLELDHWFIRPWPWYDHFRTIIRQDASYSH